MEQVLSVETAVVIADCRHGQPVRTVTKNDNHLDGRPCVATLTAGLQWRLPPTSVLMLAC